jgi:hypothetical protein
LTFTFLVSYHTLRCPCLLLATVLSVCNCWFHNRLTLLSGLVSINFRTWSYQCLLSNFTIIALHHVVVFFGVGAYQHCSLKAYCTLTPPMEFHHSSPEALHTKRRERPLPAKDGTKTKEFI